MPDAMTDPDRYQNIIGGVSNSLTDAKPEVSARSQYVADLLFVRSRLRELACNNNEGIALTACIELQRIVTECPKVE